MKNQIEEVLLRFKGRADYLEIRVEEYSQTDISIRGPKVELLREAIELGGCARAYHKGGIGFACFNRLSEMEAGARQAIEQARLVGRDRTRLAATPVVREDVPAVIAADPRAVPLAEKVEILKAYNDLILGFDPRIRTSSVRYRDGFKVVWFGSSEGSALRQERMDVSCNFAARSAGNGTTQMAHVGSGSSTDFRAILGREEEIREACRIAVELLDAPTVKSGKYTAVLDPQLSGTFVHEAFGHSSEAEKVYENEHFRELMKFGSAFGSPILNIYDSGRTTGSRGYLAYDEEGVPTEHTELIRDGILVGRLHTRETAGKLGEKPTGNGRALDYRYPPMPRMRNTCIAPGTSSLADMLAGVKLGVYALGALGGQSEEMFTFTAGHGYMIRDGRLAELVKNITLSGNLFTTLKEIDMVGSDFRQLESGGGCGKGDGRTFQYPLPVGSGAPHIRIRDVVVGGQ